MFVIESVPRCVAGPHDHVVVSFTRGVSIVLYDSNKGELVVRWVCLFIGVCEFCHVQVIKWKINSCVIFGSINAEPFE